MVTSVFDETGAKMISATSRLYPPVPRTIPHEKGMGNAVLVQIIHGFDGMRVELTFEMLCHTLQSNIAA